MKRKLALLLAGCLAISPAAAGLYPVQAFAAEAGVESKPGEQVSVSVSVSDENGTILTEKTAREANAEQYSMTVGDTRQLTAVMEQGDGFPALSTWSSETPEIIDIDDDGIITAISEGKGLISLSISYDVSQNPVEFKYEIIVNEAEAEVSEETAVVTASDVATDAAAAETADPIAAEATTDEAAAETADPTAAEATTGEAAAETADPTTAATDTTTATSETTATDATAADAAKTTIATAEAAAAPDAATAEIADPTVAATAAVASEDPTETATASIAMNSAVQTGNASSLVDPAEGEPTVITPHWEGSTSNWSYITVDGTKATGKVEIDGQTYIFTPEGLMKTGWAKYGDYWYYLEKNGRMVKGWLK